MTEILQRVPRVAYVALAVVLAVGGFLMLREETETRSVTAHFSRAVSIFEGTEVRILGVPVGEVTAVVPQGETIRVDMEYDAEFPVPEDAQAVIVTPTLTADRFVQLNPAYTSGPELEDGAVIEVQDTGTPVELDRIYRSLADVSEALGPNGVNRDGTLNNVLTEGAQFLDGQGTKANQTIVDMSRAVRTFGDGSGELFGTVRALDEFAGALAANDAVVGKFMGDLGAVSQQLAGERDELASALRNLAGVLGKVEKFVKGNRELLTKDVRNLTRVLTVMAEERAALEAVLDVGPAAMGNLHVAFDPKSGTIGSRLNFQGNVQDLDNLLCAIVRNGQIPDAALACQLFKGLLEPIEDELHLPISVPERPGAAGRQGQVQVDYRSEDPADNLTELLGGVA